MTGVWRLRAALLVLGAALVVHQGRYQLAPPAHEHELGGVHAYLGWLMPSVAALIFLATVQFAVWLRRAEGEPNPGVPSARALWASVVAAILMVFVVQESLEVAALHGHAPALMDLFGEGGWHVVWLAVVAGGFVALLLRGAARAVAWALGRRNVRRPRPPAVVVWRPVIRSARQSVLARHLAGRAPPSVA